MSLPRPIQKVVLIDIGKQKKDAASRDLERQMRELGARIQASADEAEQQQRQMQLQQQQQRQMQLQGQRGSISQQIQNLEVALQGETSAAQKDEAEAANSRNTAAGYAAGNNNWFQAAAALAQQQANAYATSAQRHRMRANQLQEQINLLNRQLTSIGN